MVKGLGFGIQGLGLLYVVTSRVWDQGVGFRV